MLYKASGRAAMSRICSAISVVQLAPGNWYFSLLREVVLLPSKNGDFLVFEELPVASPMYESEVEAWIAALQHLPYFSDARRTSTGPMPS